MTIRQDRAVSRRDAVVRLGAGGVGLALAARGLSAAAQQGTPPADQGAPDGLAIERLGFGVTEELPGAPAAWAEFQLLRSVLDPGASFLRERPQAGTVVLLYVESGALTLQFDAPLQVTRAAAMEALNEGLAPTLERIAAETAVTLEVGDSVVPPSTSEGEIRNDGDEPVVYLAAFVYNPDL